MITLLLPLSLAHAEEPLHHLHAGAAATVLVPTDRLPVDPDLGQASWSPTRVQPTLTFGNVTLWGHAELWMRFTPWSGVPLTGWSQDNSETDTTVRMEAGGRIYLRKLREGGTAPFLTVGVAPVSYRSQGGPTFSQPRLEHGIGMAVRRDDWLLTGSIGWIPFASTRYPIGRENFSESFFGSSGTIYGPSPVAVHIGLSRFFGTTEPSLRSPKELQPYVLVGVGGARTIGTITDRSSNPRSFVDSAAPPGLYPELAVGLQVGRAVAVQATYRHIEQTQEAFGLVQHWRKDSGLAQVLFEVPYGVGHVHPYVGIGAAFDKLHFTDEDFGLVDTAEGIRIGPVGELGLGYRPTDLEWLRLRTSLRFTALSFAFSDDRQVSFQHLEYTMLAAEVSPRRWR